MNALQSVSQTHRLSEVSVAREGIPGAENVTEATKGVFESIKEWVVFFWTALVTWIKNTWNATTFLFFRVVGWISPEWSAKIETWCLYGMNFWQSYTAQSRETELQEQINGLQSEKNAIETVAREVAGERDQLREENAVLRNENESLTLDNTHVREVNTRLREDQACLARERDDARRDLDAAQVDRGLVLGQVGLMNDRIQPLETQIQYLRDERDALRVQVRIHAQQQQAFQQLQSQRAIDPIALIQRALPPEQAARFVAGFQGQPCGGNYVV